MRVKQLVLFADEAALKAGLGAKAAGGIRPCFKCANCVWSSAPADITDFYSIDHTEFRSFIPQSSNNVWHIMEQLRAFQANKQQREEAEKLLGWYAIPTGIMCNPELAARLPVENCHYDPMHVYFSCGMVNLELALFVKAGKQKKCFSQADLEQFGKADWQEHRRKVKASSLFNDKILKADEFKGGATQTRLLLPLMVFMASTMRNSEDLQEERKSLELLCQSCTLVARIKANPTENDLAMLETTQKLHLEQFIHAYGRNWVRPKHHFAKHFPEQVRKVGRMVDTWATERKHRLFKLEVAPRHVKLQSFSKDVLCELVETEMLRMVNFSFEATFEKKVLAEDLCVAWPGKVVHSSNEVNLMGVASARILHSE